MFNEFARYENEFKTAKPYYLSPTATSSKIPGFYFSKNFQVCEPDTLEQKKGNRISHFFSSKKNK